MRVVDLPSRPPHRCAVVPFVGGSNARAGFFDTGMDVDGRVYISRAEAGVQIAEAIGWHPPSKVRALEEEVAAQAARIEQLEAELAEADRFKESIDYIAGEQMKPYKKAGRPKKETV